MNYYSFENGIRKFYRFFTSFQHFSTKKGVLYIVCQKKCVSLRAISRKWELKLLTKIKGQKRFRNANYSAVSKKRSS